MSLKRKAETEDEAENQFSFELSDCTDTDITFTVEGKELRFYRSLLSLTSPVFDRMLNSDFKEKTASVINLPTHTYEEMVLLFEQMHPALAIRPVTDESLALLMRLAEEYEVRHVVNKCDQYIVDQTSIMELEESISEDCTITQSSVDPDQTVEKALLYLNTIWDYPLMLSHECKLRLIQLAANRSAQQMERAKSYVSAPEEVKTAIFIRRCSMLEGLLRGRPAVQQQRDLGGCFRVPRVNVDAVTF